MEKNQRQNIAIVGTGIAGLGASYLLAPHHNLTIYEKNAYNGGHSRTVEIQLPHGHTCPVDTGFIVFNPRNYPLLTAFFAHLSVPVVKSAMSFGARIQNGFLEYSSAHLFSQKINLLRPYFWGMMWDILKFNRKALAYVEQNPSFSLGQCLESLSMGAWFRDYFLLAMGGAIWSTPLQQMLDFPASTFIRFFHNHGLLTVNDQPQWYTVQGGSREYVTRLTAGFKDVIRLNCGVKKVVRDFQGVIVQDSLGKSQRFDEVVFCCHADQALALIENPTEEERAILSQFTYHPNRIVLHRDISFMPKRKTAWASWVYLSEGQKEESHVCLSYWMNNLQPLGTSTPIIATLNPPREPKEHLVDDEHWFDHPIFNSSAILAQKEIDRIQGKDRFWFCGAYLRYGFHEDGLWSSVTMASRKGITPPWT